LTKIVIHPIKDDRNRLNWNSFVYTAGFRAGLITGQFDGSVNGFWDSYSITVVGAEIGFRNINGSNTFFFGVYTDIMMIVIYLISLFANPN